MSQASVPPFQFTLRQLLLLMVACSIVLALLFHWGMPGFACLYGLVSLSALGFGLYRGATLFVAGGAILLMIGMCFGLEWLNAVGHGHSSRRMYCQNNLHNITIALQSYHDVQGSFPPAYVADANGKPMHSWRVLILPYLDQYNLYKSYRFDEPWDGPNNRKLHDIALKIYSCPSRDRKQPTTDTSYVAVFGPQTMWQSEKATSHADITDSSYKTIMLVEVHNSGIHWMEPRDLHVVQMPMAINGPQGQGISSPHNGGAHVALVDGGVRFLINTTPPETLRALLTIAGGEAVGDY